MSGKRIAHLIPEGLTSHQSRKARGGGKEEYLVALCGAEVNPAQDDGYYFTPHMAKHRQGSDNLCWDCIAAHESRE